MTRFFFLLVTTLFLSLSAQADDYKSTFDRVMATNTIRCGYIVYPPQLSKDANSGTLSGLAYDIVEQMGKDMGVKIAWVEEVGPGTMLEGLQANRYDMVCNPLWATTPRVRIAAYTAPLFFTAVNAYGRNDDYRFDGKLELANAPAVTVATIDGGTAAQIAGEDYPLAKLDSLPEMTDFSHLLLEVQTGKADLTFSEAAQFAVFSVNNPGTLRNLTPEKPVRLVANAFPVRGDETRLLAAINTALTNLRYSGFVDRTLSRYEPAPGVWRRVALPYQ